MGVFLWFRRPFFLACLPLLPFLLFLLPFLLLVCFFAIFSFSLFRCLFDLRPQREERGYAWGEGEEKEEKEEEEEERGEDDWNSERVGDFIRKRRNASKMLGEEKAGLSDLECMKLSRVHDYLENQLCHLALPGYANFTAPKDSPD